MDTDHQKSRPFKVAILSRGDAAARRDTTPQNSRFLRVFEALAAAGIEAQPAIYDEAFADAVRDQLLTVDGVLVWVDPIHQGKTRAALDPLLREVARRGPWVSAHPDVILKMGVKEVLYRTRHLGWGADTHRYDSAAAFRAEFPQRLRTGGPRVLKQNRGNGGQGVWKVVALPGSDATVSVLQALRGSRPEELPLDDFIARCDLRASGRLPRLHAHLPGDHSGRSSGRERVHLGAFALAFALALISPGERGFEVRTFECSTCARTEQVSVSIDPMNGDGWAGSLANSGRRAEPASLVRALLPGLLVTPLRPITDGHLADVRLVDAVGLVALAGRARPAHAHPSSASHVCPDGFRTTTRRLCRLGSSGSCLGPQQPLGRDVKVFDFSDERRFDPGSL